MEKEFVPYEQALALEELGFDEPCFAVYIDKTLIMEDDWLYSTNQDTFIESSNFTAPLYQQAFRWFREKYNLYPSINIYNDKWLCVIKSTVSSETEISGYIVAIINNGHPTFDTYPEAELACLEKLIEIVEKYKL